MNSIRNRAEEIIKSELIFVGYNITSLTALRDCKAVFSLHRVCTRQPLF